MEFDDEKKEDSQEVVEFSFEKSNTGKKKRKVTKKRKSHKKTKDFKEEESTNITGNSQSQNESQKEIKEMSLSKSENEIKEEKNEDNNDNNKDQEKNEEQKKEQEKNTEENNSEQKEENLEENKDNKDNKEIKENDIKEKEEENKDNQEQKNNEEINDKNKENKEKENIQEKTELGLKAKSFMDKGQLVPDSVVIDIVKDRLSKDDCKEGYVLDGFPRTVAQAEALSSFAKINFAIDIAVVAQKVIDRIASRRVCKCSATYDIHMHPSDVCDVCGEKLYQRDDDKEDWLSAYVEHFKDNELDNLNPLNLLPLAKDVISMMQGYDATSFTGEGINNIIKSIEVAKNRITKQSTKTIWGDIYQYAKGISQVTGVPAYNLMRDFKTLYNNLNDLWGGNDLLTTESKVKAQEKKKQQNTFEKAIDTNDLTTIKAAMTDVYDNAIESGSDESDS